MYDRAVPNNLYVEAPTGFTMIGLPLGERSQPLERSSLLPRAQSLGVEKLLNVWLKNASLGQIWSVGPNLNILDNNILIVEIWATSESGYYEFYHLYIFDRLIF